MNLIFELSGDVPAASHREMGKQLAPRAEEHYRRLGRADAFRFVVFEGGHEFHDPTAWEWLKHLWGLQHALCGHRKTV